jgi:hypothetical protein
LAGAFCCPAFGQNTIVAANKVVDNNGALLNTGQFCFGATCLTVTNGAIPSGSAVTPATASIVVKITSTTFLTVPNVTIAGSFFSWDSYVVPSNAVRKPNHATSSTLPSRLVSSHNYAPSPSTGQDVVRITLTQIMLSNPIFHI